MSVKHRYFKAFFAAITLLLIASLTLPTIWQSTWLLQRMPSMVPTAQLLRHLRSNDSLIAQKAYRQLNKLYVGDKLNEQQIQALIKTVFITSALIDRELEEYPKHRPVYSHSMVTDRKAFSSLSNWILVDTYENGKMSQATLQWIIHCTLDVLQRQSALFSDDEINLWLMLFIEKKHLKPDDFQQLADTIQQVMQYPTNPAIGRCINLMIKAKACDYLNEQQFKAFDDELLKQLPAYMKYFPQDSVRLGTLRYYMHTFHQGMPDDVSG